MILLDIKNLSNLAAAAVVAAGLLWSTAGAAETIAMIGTGEVGTALGQRFAEQGHTIAYGSRNPSSTEVRELVQATGNGAVAVTPAEAAARSDIVFLAVPWRAAEDIVRGLGDLTGKIIVDPTNGRSVMADDGFADYADYPIEESSAERIASLAPGAHVVKAFNTLDYLTMDNPAVADGPVTVPVVGDDRAAKERVVALARAIGLEALDVGPLRHARIIEGLRYLRVNALGGRINFHFSRDTTND